jgi:hypothetical protein
MRALLVAPPAVLIAGCGAVAVQLRRIASQRSALADAAHDLETDRLGLGRLSKATERTRASLEDLERQ